MSINSMVYITIRTLSQCIHGKNTIRVWKILMLVLTSLRIGYSVITGLPIGYSVITGLPRPIRYSVITGLPIGYSVIIIALTGLPIGYSVIVVPYLLVQQILNISKWFKI